MRPSPPPHATPNAPSNIRVCEHCGRPYGHALRCLPDGRWLSPAGLWVGPDGAPAPWPDVVEYARVRTSRSVVGLYRRRAEAAVAAMTASERHRLCRRCYLVTGREEHRRVARMRALMRFALGDLFEGTYQL